MLQDVHTGDTQHASPLHINTRSIIHNINNIT